MKTRGCNVASVIIGRAACPECGFAAAHVKKSDKCHYRYCPECGSQYYAKSQRQVDELLKKTRLDGAATGSGVSATAAEKPTVKIDTAPPATGSGGDTATAPVVQPRRIGLGLFQ